MNKYDVYDKQAAEGTTDAAFQQRSLAGPREATFSTFYRFVVLDVVFDPQIVDDTKIAYWEHTLGVKNISLASVLPRNTIIARRVAEGSASDAEQPMFLFPMLPPQISLPCNPGEHVWVMFENKSIKKADLGYWLCRIVAPGFVEDVNHTHYPRTYDSSFHPDTKDIYDGTDKPAYEFRPGAVSEIDGGRQTTVETSTLPIGDEQIYESLMKDSDGAKLRQYEPVPRYRKRPGDTALEGSNNALVVIGQHRTGPVASYTADADRGKVPTIPETDIAKPGTGMIDLVAGRGQTAKTAGKIVSNSMGNQEIGKSTSELVETEGDIDFSADRSRILVAQKAKIDTDFSLDSYNSKLSVADSTSGDGAVAVKSDKVRIIARSDVTIVVSGFTSDENGNMVTDENEDNWATIIVRKDGNIISKPAKNAVMTVDDEEKAKFVALENLVKNELQAIRDEHNKFITEKYNIHVHPHQMGPTQQTTQQASTMGPAGDVASKKLRTT